MFKSLKRWEASYFVLASVGAGALHYFFQVVAARQMPPEEFGRLSGWSAYVGLLSALGLFAQSLANFHPSKPTILRWQSAGSLALCLLLTAAITAGQVSDLLVLAAVSTVLAVLLGWMTGQTQAQKLFWRMGSATLFVGALKFGASLGGAENSLLFFWGFALCSSIGIVYLALGFLARGSTGTITPSTSNASQGVAPAAILAFATMLVPQYDMIYVHLTQPPDVVGEFARVSLIYRAVFFFVLIFAQYLLPHQIQSQAEAKSPMLKRYLFAVIGGLLIAGLAALLAPPIGSMVLKFDLSPQRSWIFWSSFNITLLTILFLWIQGACAKRKAGEALRLLLPIIIAFVAVFPLKLPPATYLPVMTTVNFLIVMQRLLTLWRTKR